MKIGTDAVLLGAWCSVYHEVETILDIGTGTGIIALQLAQRSDANTIDAVEIDALAFEQATNNFEQSNWSDRLYCYHTSFADFVKEISSENETYDLIITNPPFYSDTFETQNDSRNKARFTSSLSFKSLIEGVSKLLSKKGTFSVIIPFKEEPSFIALALSNQLYLQKACRVRGTIHTNIKRSLLEFSFEESETSYTELTIEYKRHVYTEEYIYLTKDFYLKM